MACVVARIKWQTAESLEEVSLRTEVCAEDFSSNVMEATNIFTKMPCGSWRALAAPQTRGANPSKKPEPAFEH